VELDIRYARNGGVAIAYQVVGDGSTDLVYVPISCPTRGERELKGVPGKWRLYAAAEAPGDVFATSRRPAASG
jgi:hypothetical protein